MNPTTANYDEPWKEALSEYFEAFLHFLLLLLLLYGSYFKLNLKRRFNYTFYVCFFLFSFYYN